RGLLACYSVNALNCVKLKFYYLPQPRLRIGIFAFQEPLDGRINFLVLALLRQDIPHQGIQIEVVREIAEFRQLIVWRLQQGHLTFRAVRETRSFEERIAAFRAKKAILAHPGSISLASFRTTRDFPKRSASAPLDIRSTSA